MYLYGAVIILLRRELERFTVFIVRAPLRVSLVGGGCDLPTYYENYGATIVSFAITRYIYVVHNDRPTGGCRLSYSTVEELDHLTSAQHTLVKATAADYPICEPCTLSIISDVPKGTGLGSSSALCVCLCKLGGASGDLADAAYRVENGVNGNVGKQDHLPAVHGGLNAYEIATDGTVLRNPLMDKDMLNEYGLLLYTGTNRPSSSVLGNWAKSTNHLHMMYALAQRAKQGPWTPDRLGDILNRGWSIKMQIPGVCTPALHAQYLKAIHAGALGGKLLGAGAGGCWFFIVSREKRGDVRDSLGLCEIPFKVAEKGCETWVI